MPGPLASPVAMSLLCERNGILAEVCGLQGGEHATGPAKLVAIYFSNLGDLSRDYVRNPYRS